MMEMHCLAHGILFSYCHECYMKTLKIRYSEGRTVGRIQGSAFTLLGFLVVLFVAFTAAAQVPTFDRNLEVCDRGVVRGCDPPTALQVLGTRPPLDAPVRFGGTVARFGDTYWLWIRVGDPSRPCTAAQKADKNTMPECNAKVGDVLLMTQRFRRKQ